MSFDLQKMMKALGGLQERARQVQERLAHETVTGDAGGGMVVVEMNGLQQVLRVTIDPDLVKEGDVAMIEDMAAAAFNRAHEALERLVRESAPASLDLGDLFKDMGGD